MGKWEIPGKWTGESTPDPESGHEFYSRREKCHLRAGIAHAGRFLHFASLRSASVEMTCGASGFIHCVMVVISTDRREWRNLLPGTRFVMYISAAGWYGCAGAVQYKFVFIFLFVFYILILIHIVFRRHSAADCGRLRQESVPGCFFSEPGRGFHLQV